MSFQQQFFCEVIFYFGKEIAKGLVHIYNFCYNPTIIRIIAML